MSMGSLAVAEGPIGAQTGVPADKKCPPATRRIVAKADAVERPEAR
jgi:hypothetical protein